VYADAKKVVIVEKKERATKSGEQGTKW